MRTGWIDEDGRRGANRTYNIHGLGNLEWLWLHNNALEGIQAGTFEGLGSLSLLSLWGNNLSERFERF